MPLDPSIFLQGAALQQRNNDVLLNSLNQGLDRVQRNKALKLEAQKAAKDSFDFDKLAQQSALKIQSGQGTPEDENILKTWDQFNQTKLMMNPETGEYTRANASIFDNLSRGTDFVPQNVQRNLATVEPVSSQPLESDMLASPGFFDPTQEIGPVPMDVAQIENVIGPVSGQTAYNPNPPLLPGANTGFNMQALEPQIVPPVGGNTRLNRIAREEAVKANVDLQKEAAKIAAEKQKLMPIAEGKVSSAAQRAQEVDKTIEDAINMTSNVTAGFGSNIKDVKLPFTNIRLGAGSKANDLSAALDTIKADAAFSELQKMRDNSPNGSALGQVTEIELKLLQSAAASLEQSQSPEKLKENLQKYRKTRQAALKNVSDAFEKQYGYRPELETPSPQGNRKKWTPEKGIH